MKNSEQDCAFCDYGSEEMARRTVYFGTTVLTIVSRPWYRPNHLLVVPKRHHTTMNDLADDEKQELIEETSLLSSIVGTEFGYLAFQKHRPLQAANSITMQHLHMHVYPLLESDSALVPVPDERSFKQPTDEQISESREYVQRERAKLFLPRER